MVCGEGAARLVVSQGEDGRDEEGLVPDIRHQDQGDGGVCKCQIL